MIGSLGKVQLKKCSNVKHARRIVAAFDRKYPNVITKTTEQHIKEHGQNSTDIYCPGDYFLGGMLFSSIFIFLSAYGISKDADFLFVIFSMIIGIFTIFQTFRGYIKFKPNSSALRSALARAKVKHKDYDKLVEAYKVIWSYETSC